VVDRSSFSCVGSLFHARGAATAKAVSPIRRRVRGTTRSPDDEARSADRAIYPRGQFQEERFPGGGGKCPTFAMQVNVSRFLSARLSVGMW